MRRVRGRPGPLSGSLPRSLARRVRALFAVFALVVVALQFGMLFGLDLLPALVGGLAIFGTLGWVIWQYRTASSSIVHDIVPAVGLTLSASIYQNLEFLFAPLWVCLYLRGLHVKPSRVPFTGGMFLVALFVNRFIVGGKFDAPFIVTLGIMFGFTAGIMAIIGQAIAQHERIVRYGDITADAGVALVKARTSDEVHEAVRYGIEWLADATPGVRARQWMLHDGTFVDYATPDEPQRVPPDRVPARWCDMLAAGQVVRGAALHPHPLVGDGWVDAAIVPVNREGQVRSLLVVTSTDASA